MSREIKFRIWNGSKWLDDAVVLSLTGNLCDLLLTRVNNFSKCTIQQFTGLKDKNGKEIYEGDIYNLDGWTNNPYFCVWYDGIYWNRQVKQTDQNFFNNHVNLHCNSQHTLREHAKYAQIIGNIFENPELLTK